MLLNWLFDNISSWNYHNTVHLPPYEVQKIYTLLTCVFIANVINMQKFDSLRVSPPTFQRKTKHRGDLLKFIYKLGKLPSSVSSDMQWRIHDLLKGGRNGLESWGCLTTPLSPGQRPDGWPGGGVKLPGLGFNKAIFTVVLDI